MRQQRERSDTDRLSQRHHQKDDIAGGGHACDRGISNAADEIQIDEIVERLKNHAARDRDRKPDEMLLHRTICQIAQMSPR